MYTSLLKISINFSVLIRIDSTFPTFLEKHNIPFLEHYLLVRNPYRRAISFYKEKFHSLVLEQKNNLRLGWQDVQKTIFPYLDIDEKKDSKEQIFEKWNISFADFTNNILPKVYEMDRHLTPQHWIYCLQGKRKGKFIADITKKRPIFENVKIIKIDDREAMVKLSEKINLDFFNTKVNNTQAVESPALTPDFIKIINRIYKDDFKIFDYPKL